MLVRNVPDWVLGLPAQVLAVPVADEALTWIAGQVHEDSGGAGLSVVYSVNASREFHSALDVDLSMRAAHQHSDAFALPIVCPLLVIQGVPVDCRISASWTATGGRRGDGQWLLSACPPGVRQDVHETAVTLLWDALERGESLPVHDAYTLSAAVVGPEASGPT